MTPEQKRLAQRAFGQLLPLADLLSVMFYSRLFEIDPALRKLFTHNMADQGHALMTMLQLSIEGLDATADVTYALQQLGARHNAYGVQPDQYATIQSALLWTMAQGLGAAYTAEVEAALRAMLEAFSAVMLGKETAL